VVQSHYATLRYTTHYQRGNTLLLTPDINLHRHTRLSTKRHPYHGGNLAPCNRLAVQLERMCRGGEGNIGAVQGL